VKRVDLKLEDDLHAQFKNYCDKKRRSVPQQILYMIEQLLEDEEIKGGQQVVEAE